MKRELPVYTIEGTDFFVDVDKRSLVQVGDKNNTIDFIDLRDKGTHYEMLYDLRDKNWPPGVGPMDNKMIDIKIPPMVMLDPVGMAEKYGLTVAEVHGKTDKEVMAKPLLPKLHEGKYKGRKI